MRQDSLIVLGIESTAHTIGFGIASSDGRILANVNYSYVPKDRGLHPREEAQHHATVADKALKEALSISRVSVNEIDAVAFSIGPGMGPCLRTGATIARALAVKLNRPLIGVNHGIAHIEIGRLVTGCKDPVILYVAGGNCLIASYKDGRYRIFGETLDITASNCLDVFGIQIGLGPMPAPEIKASEGKQILHLPYVVKGMDMSFSGLLTQALKLVKQGTNVEDVCLSITETVYSMLTEVTERALAFTEKDELLLVGGLAKSNRLKHMLMTMCDDRSAKFFTVPTEYAGDNGAQIAWTGILYLLHGKTIPIDRSYVRPRFRIDQEEVPWMRF